MFDIGFWELTVIGVIALLVVGPERLPGLARNVGMWVGRIRRYVAHVKEDIERELHAEEVKALLQKPEPLSDLEDVVGETRSAIADAGRGLSEGARSSGQGEKVETAADTPAASGISPSSKPTAEDDPFGASSLSRVAPAAPGAETESAPDTRLPDNEQASERQG